MGDKSKQKKCAFKQVLLLKPNMILYISEAILGVQTNQNFDINRFLGVNNIWYERNFNAF